MMRFILRKELFVFVFNWKQTGSYIFTKSCQVENGPWSNPWADWLIDRIIVVSVKVMVWLVQESLYCMAESASFNFIFAAVLDAAFSQKRWLNWPISQYFLTILL